MVEAFAQTGQQDADRCQRQGQQDQRHRHRHYEDEDTGDPDVVGAPGENADGLLWTARGATAGPVTSGSKTLSGTAAGAKRRYADVEFGAALPGARQTG